jgi:hypothetical protein
MMLFLPRITALARFLVGFHRSSAVGGHDRPTENNREGR